MKTLEEFLHEIDKIVDRNENNGTTIRSEECLKKACKIIREMKSALEFYASFTNYHLEGDVDDEGNYFLVKEILRDEGRIAQKALEGINICKH